MPVHWTDTVGAVAVDWNAVEDKCAVHLSINGCVHDPLCILRRDAGLFNYGFISDDKSIPFAFYMKVRPLSIPLVPPHNCAG